MLRFLSSCFDLKSEMRLERTFNRTILLLPLLACLWSAGGCNSSSGPSQDVTVPDVNKNASLKGHYTYRMSGNYFGLTDGNGPYHRAGTFVADGDGHITDGIDDLVQGFSTSTNPFTGSYRISSDGTGLLTLNLPPQAIQLAITMTSSSNAYLIAFDATSNGAGGLFAQNPDSLASPPSGTFAFSYHSERQKMASSGAVSAVGGVTFNGDGTLSGSLDLMRGGVPILGMPLTGNFTAPDATGKGTLTFIDGNGFLTNFFFYVIDSHTVNLMGSDLGVVSNGRLELQTGAPFSNASLSGGVVFRSRGDTPLHANGVNTVGAFIADGGGGIADGSYDSMQDGVPISAPTLAGSYVVDATGRATITLNPQGLDPVPHVAWLVNSSRAFYLVATPGRTEDGTTLQQEESSFDATSLKGQYSFDMFGSDGQSPAQIDRAGIAKFDGSSVMTLSNYFVNRSGSRMQTKSADGTYSVAANGRVSGSIDGISGSIVMYLVSGSAGYFILEDSATEVSGIATLQSLP